MCQSRINELANTIQKNTAKVDEYISRNSLPQLSFDENGPSTVGTETSPEANRARIAAMEASLELYDLLQGPALQLRPVLNGAALQFIYKYNIAAKVPFGGEASFGDIAKKIGYEEPLVRRILRFAMAHHHVFQEREAGYVSHTAASRLLADEPRALDGLGVMFEESYQAFAHTVEALEKFNGSQEPNQAGWQIANNTDMPIFAYMAQQPLRAKRFASAMAAFSNSPGVSPQLLASTYEWNEIGGGVGLVVDVGGGAGNISAVIAAAAPGLKFIVQDLPNAIKNAKDALPSDITAKGRIEFQAHSFFNEQPVQADAYLFRNIFHNWSDEYVVKILKALIPALKPGAIIIINDYLIPEANTAGLIKERQARDMDMIMLSLLNARDREKQEWIELFARVDPGFKNIRFRLPEDATLAIIDCVWHP